MAAANESGSSLPSFFSPDIVKKLGSPQTRQSLDSIHRTAVSVREAMNNFTKPQTRDAIEKAVRATESFEHALAKLESSVQEMKAEGRIAKSQNLLRSSTSAIKAIGAGGAKGTANTGTPVEAITETARSLSDLIQELRAAIKVLK